MSQAFRTEVLQQLRDSGSDAEKPHEFDFYLYLPTQSAARQAALRLRESLSGVLSGVYLGSGLFS
jgi:hypothetical protein